MSCGGAGGPHDRALRRRRATGPREDGIMQKIVPNLWFDTEAEEAAAHYTSLFKDSKILNVAHYGEAGPRPAGMVMTVSFELAGQEFVAINMSLIHISEPTRRTPIS